MCTLDAYHRTLATSVWLTPSRAGASARPQHEYYSTIRLHTNPGPRVLNIWPEEVGSVCIAWSCAWPASGSFALTLVTPGGVTVLSREYEVEYGTRQIILPKKDHALFTAHWPDLTLSPMDVSEPNLCTVKYVPSCKLMDSAYISSAFERLVPKLFTLQEKKTLLDWGETLLREDAVNQGLIVHELRLKQRREHFMRHASVITMHMLQSLRKDRSLLQKPDLNDCLQIFLSRVPFEDSGLCAV